MVRVDLGAARRAISKRQRRRRAIASRREKRMQRQQQKEIMAAAAARHARVTAVANWDAEEKRLEEERATKKDTQTSSNDNNNPPHKKRRVIFSDNVYVTEIPVDCGDKLPAPVARKIGEAIAGEELRKTREEEEANKQRRVQYLKVNDDWSVESEDEEQDPAYTPALEGCDEMDIETSGEMPQLRRMPSRGIDETMEQGEDVLVAHEGLDDDDVPIRNGVRTSPLVDSDMKLDQESKREDSTDLRANKSEQTTPTKVNKSDQSNQSQTTRSVTPVNGSLKRKKPDSPTDSASDSTSSPPSSPKTPETCEMPPDTTPEISEEAASKNSSSAKKRKRKKRKVASQEQSNKLSPTSKIAKVASSKLSNSAARETSPHASDARLANTVTSNPSDSTKNNKDSASDDDKEEINALFAKLNEKRAAERAAKKAQKEIDDAASDMGSAKSKKKKSKKAGGKPRKYTEDGLRIMTVEELREDQPEGLNGPCPFDCACCI